MTSTAIAFAVGALLLYGGWAVAASVATRSLSPVNAVLLSYVASLVVVGGYAVSTRQPLAGARIDVAFALASGVMLAAGAVFFYTALGQGNVAVVSAISALYFIIPVIAGVLYFDAVLSTTNLVGIALAVVAVVLISA
ncbi:EamA family transporter [Halobacterium zhouii]|uniref:EamA family transporter n=1 Tax=Halobacterium zhouii TaxID=2902624 RepID=UPI001E5C577F|nr:EamA family transporter [Halobacterium zhouii]